MCVGRPATFPSPRYRTVRSPFLRASSQTLAMRLMVLSIPDSVIGRRLFRIASIPLG